MKRTLVAVLSVLMLSGMAAAAESDGLPNPGSMPGDLFYGLDKAGESIQLAMASAPVIGSSAKEANVRSDLAAERLAEAQRLAELNRSDDLGEAVNRFERQSEMAVEAANRSGDKEVANHVEDNLQKHVQVLERVKEKVPEEAKDAIQNAIEKSQNRANGIRKAVENGGFAPKNNTDGESFNIPFGGVERGK